MEKTLFLILLSFGMCCINGYAQTKKPVKKGTSTQNTTPPAKEYMVTYDGFEWYRTYQNGKYGAEDKNGKILIPVEYDKLYADSRTPYPNDFVLGIFVKKGGDEGYYDRNGKCIIPTTRHYTSIYKRGDLTYHEMKPLGIHYLCRRENQFILCDITGKEVQILNTNGEKLSPYCLNGKFYYLVTKDHKYGIWDVEGNVIVEPKYEFVYSSSSRKMSGDYFYIKNDSTGQEEIVGFFSSIKSTYNPLADNPSTEPTSVTASPPYENNTGNNNSNNSNSVSTTRTVVVEHHRDPIPVQEWQPCMNCMGEGKVMCLGACGGTGTYYVGNRLNICSSCNGSGKKTCPNCFGQGGQYITVYR